MDAGVGLLEAIHEDPQDSTAWQVLADWLEDRDQAQCAELVRLREQIRGEPDHPDRGGWEKQARQVLAAGVKPFVPSLTFLLARQVGLELALVVPGRFTMGSPENEKGRFPREVRRPVTLTRAFYLAVFPVTQAQWHAVTREDPSMLKGRKRPVENVSWEACVGFCEKLSEKLQRRFRLPTEAEWEYACRAGTTTPFCSGKGVSALRQVGWASYDGHTGSLGEHQVVGQLQPNAWGFYDMHGNVLEWCLDRFGHHDDSEVTDPIGPDDGDERVLRGGSWYAPPRYCRSAYRAHCSQTADNECMGVRVLMEWE
jgi:uncharacterized protein (TIGR02996 family)